MAQISLYIDEVTATDLNVAARAENCSISKYVAAIISRHLYEDRDAETRKQQTIKELRGALDDQLLKGMIRIREK